jgi:nicotinate-nucleotide adenylyltransferase
MTDFINILLPPTKISLKIGLFFGSFNPVHIGHMAIANYIAEFTDIDQVWLVVSPQNPLKDKEILLNDYDRLELMHKAIDDDRRFRACDIEFSLPKPSYTFDTLSNLSIKYPDHHFSVIMGSDNLNSIHEWKNFREILDKYKIIVYPRPGAEALLSEIPGNIMVLQSPMMEISSTFIRDSVKAGKNMKFFLPPKVWDYIEMMNYYKK